MFFLYKTIYYSPLYLVRGFITWPCYPGPNVLGPCQCMGMVQTTNRGGFSYWLSRGSEVLRLLCCSLKRPHSTRDGLERTKCVCALLFEAADSSLSLTKSSRTPKWKLVRSEKTWWRHTVKKGHTGFLYFFWVHENISCLWDRKKPIWVCNFMQHFWLQDLQSHYDLLSHRSPKFSCTLFLVVANSNKPMLPCNSPKADPGLAMASPPANFRKLVSLELGRGLGVLVRLLPVKPSKLDCLMLAIILKRNLAFHFPKHLKNVGCVDVPKVLKYIMLYYCSGHKSFHYGFIFHLVKHLYSRHDLTFKMENTFGTNLEWHTLLK